MTFAFLSARKRIQPRGLGVGVFPAPVSPIVGTAPRRCLHLGKVATAGCQNLCLLLQSSQWHVQRVWSPLAKHRADAGSARRPSASLAPKAYLPPGKTPSRPGLPSARLRAGCRSPTAPGTGLEKCCPCPSPMGLPAQERRCPARGRGAAGVFRRRESFKAGGRRRRESLWSSRAARALQLAMLVFTFPLKFLHASSLPVG